MRVGQCPAGRRGVFPVNLERHALDTVRNVLAAARDRDGVTFDAAGRTTGYSFREFGSSSWKAANLLRHYGVHAGVDVAVDVEPERAVGAAALVTLTD